MGCQIFLLFGDPFLQGLQLLAKDGRRSLLDLRADPLSSVLDLLVGRGALEIGLDGQDFLGERAVLVEPVSEGLREDLSIIVVASVLGCTLWLVGFADRFGFLFWRHSEDKF